MAPRGCPGMITSSDWGDIPPPILRLLGSKIRCEVAPIDVTLLRRKEKLRPVFQVTGPFSRSHCLLRKTPQPLFCTAPTCAGVGDGIATPVITAAFRSAAGQRVSLQNSRQSGEPSLQQVDLIPASFVRWIYCRSGVADIAQNNTGLERRVG